MLNSKERVVHKMNIVLYSTHCHNCKSLKLKLNEKNIDFVEVNDIEIMTEKGFMQAPMLEVDGLAMNYKAACIWLSEV